MKTTNVNTKESFDYRWRYKSPFFRPITAELIKKPNNLSCPLPPVFVSRKFVSRAQMNFTQLFAVVVTSADFKMRSNLCVTPIDF